MALVDKLQVQVSYQKIVFINYYMPLSTRLKTINNNDIVYILQIYTHMYH